MNAMMAVDEITIQWHAVLTKPPHNRNWKTTVIGADYEAYQNKQGQACHRRLKDTGTRVFVPEFILRKYGFEVFMPVKKRWRIKNHHTKEKQLVRLPLIANWMFVGWPVDKYRQPTTAVCWEMMMQLDVVSGVLGTGGKPALIHGRDIQRMMGLHGGGNKAPANIHRYMRRDCEFEVGDDVRVIEGVLAGRTVKILSIDGPQVKAVTKLLGRSFVADLAAYDLAGGGVGAH